MSLQSSDARKHHTFRDVIECTEPALTMPDYLVQSRSVRRELTMGLTLKPLHQPLDDIFVPFTHAATIDAELRAVVPHAS